MPLNDFSTNSTNKDGNNNGNNSIGAFMNAMGGSLSSGGNAEDILVNYNDTCLKANPVLHRDDALSQLNAVLINMLKPNAMLIGEAGTGKTAIVKELARRIANKMPSVYGNVSTATIYELPIASLVAGTSHRGSLEAKLAEVLSFCENPANNAILFIDEIHLLIDPRYAEIGQMMKPYLGDNKVRVIGATTTQESQVLMKDPAFNRRFSTVIIHEPSVDETVDVLRTLISPLSQHHKRQLTLADDDLRRIVMLADEHRVAGSHRPDNAIKLLDNIVSEAAVRFEKKLEWARTNDPAIYGTLKLLQNLPINTDVMRSTAIKLVTGSAKKGVTDPQHLEDELNARIKGQSGVIPDIVNAIRVGESPLFTKRTPVSFLFAGKSGVGKTEVAKIISEIAMGKKPITINMTEYNDSASLNRIIGSPDGYIGSDSNAERPLDPLISDPYQVVLLDEFEKGDPAVQRLFMQALDEGYITTNRNQRINFSHAIVIATTNASHTNVRTSVGFNTEGERSQNAKVRDLKGSFSPELLNRFTLITTFSDIDKATYADIVIDRYARERERLVVMDPSMATKLPVDIPEDELSEIVEKTYLPDFGARPARKAVEQYITSLA